MELTFLTKEKIIFLLVNVVIGSLLLFSYYYYIKNGGIGLKTLWGFAYPHRNIFYVSMVFALISWLLIFEFVLLSSRNSLVNARVISNLSTVQAIIIVVSMLWLPLVLIYAKSKTNPKNPFLMLGILFVLLVVALASLKQIFIIRKIEHDNCKVANLSKNLAIAGGVYFFIHTFFFDFLAWDYSFFSQFKV